MEPNKKEEVADPVATTPEGAPQTLGVFVAENVKSVDVGPGQPGKQ